jgi:hypothetical protein
LQALSGMWEFFFLEGGMQISELHAIYSVWWLHWGKEFYFCNLGTLVYNTLYIMMITHRNWRKGNCKCVCSDWMKSESNVLIQK